MHSVFITNFNKKFVIFLHPAKFFRKQKSSYILTVELGIAELKKILINYKLELLVMIIEITLV